MFTRVLRTDFDASVLWGYLKRWKESRDAGRPLEVSIKEWEPRRSLDQNAMFHAICSAVSKSGTEWAGKKRTAQEWKILFISGHMIATQTKPDIVPGLEGEFINLRESSSRMSKARAASLIHYVEAWCAENGINIYQQEAA